MNLKIIFLFDDRKYTITITTFHLFAILCDLQSVLSYDIDFLVIPDTTHIMQPKNKSKSFLKNIHPLG